MSSKGSHVKIFFFAISTCQFSPFAYREEEIAASPKESIHSSMRGIVRFVTASDIWQSRQKQREPSLLRTNTISAVYMVRAGSTAIFDNVAR